MDHEREAAEAEPPSSGAALARPVFPTTIKERERTAGFPQSERVRAFRRRHFPQASADEWNDWRWQMRNRIRDLEELERIFRLSDDERDAVARQTGPLPVGITPYYASLISDVDASQPLRRTHIMTGDEYLRMPGEADDPLGEDHDTAVPGLVHRYPDRVLFLTTGYLLDLLPLLHAQPHGRRPAANTRSQPGTVAARSTTSQHIRRSATCCCRAAIR